MRNLQAATLMALALTLGDAASADSMRRVLDIKPQSIKLALRDLGQQTGIQILFRAEDVARAGMSPQILGEMSPKEALERMLQGEPTLMYEWMNPHTVLISSKDSSAADRAALLPQIGESRLARLNADPVPASEGETSEAAGKHDNLESTHLEEILVTAQRRKERLQDVPMSVTVLGGEELDDSSATGITEALRNVPGVVTNVSIQGGGTTLSIRGVGASGANFNGSTPIGYYLDSAPFALVKGATVPDVAGYDLDRIEVVRGPQGTLYGASALGGVVRVLTQAPDLQDYEFKSRISGASTEHGAESSRFDAALNLPLVEDVLAVRGVIGVNHVGGWVDRPNGSGDDANDTEAFNARFRILAKPTERLSIGLLAQTYHDDYGSISTSVDNRTSPLIDEPGETVTSSYGVNVEYDFGGYTLTSATSFLDFFNDGFMQATLGTLNTEREATMFSQEFSLTSNGAGPWRWSLGAMYRDAEDVAIQRYGILTTQATLNWVDHSTSVAVFGELTRLLLDDRFEVTAGVRYFQDEVSTREREDFSLNYVFLGIIPTANGLDNLSDDFDKVTPRLVLTWHATDDITTYASYSQGFRSGGQQNPVVYISAPGFPAFEADTLTNYEIGTHGRTWNGRLSFDAAVYYVDWQDVQQALTVPYGGTFVNAVANGESASGFGYEVAATFRPIDGLTFRGAYSRNYIEHDAEIRNLATNVLLVSAGAPVGIPYTGSVSAEYELGLGSSGFDVRLGTSAYLVGSSAYYTSTGATGANDDLIIARAEIGVYSPDDQWIISLFGDNIFNEEGVQNAGPGAYTNVFARPRTVGLQLTVKY